MKRNAVFRAVVVGVCSVGCWGGRPVAADRPVVPRSILEQALDENSEIELHDVTMSEAVRIVAEQTGVQLRASVETLAVLPYGPDTRVSAEIRNVPLRQGLAELLGPLGLRFEVVENHVAIKPIPAVQRLARPATWAELDLLGRLRGMEWSTEALEGLPLRLIGELAARQDARQDLRAVAAQQAPGNMIDLLNTACDATGWSWWPEEDHLVLATRERGVKHVLSRTVALRYTRWPLRNVLLDLARTSGLLLKMEPGVLWSLPNETRESISLVAEDVSVEQALELISGVTGLSYRVADGALILESVSPAESRRAGTAARAGGDPLVGKVVVPSPSGEYQFEFVLRESDLPPELNELRRERIRRAVEAMEIELAQ